MFDFIINASLKQRLIVLGVSLLLIIYGALTVRQMPVDVFPDLNKPTVTLMTEAGGMAAEEVEQLITFPLETTMNGLPGVESVRSTSSAGSLTRIRSTSICRWGGILRSVRGGGSIRLPGMKLAGWASPKRRLPGRSQSSPPTMDCPSGGGGTLR